MADGKRVAHNTSILIREFMLKAGRPVAPSEVRMYVCKRKAEEGYTPPSYQTIFKYIYVLKELGLIRKVGSGRYVIVAERAGDPAWLHPQSALYPATRLGRRRYSRLKSMGSEPRGRRKA